MGVAGSRNKNGIIAFGLNMLAKMIFFIPRDAHPQSGLRKGWGPGRENPPPAVQAKRSTALRRARKGASLRDEDSSDKGLSSLWFSLPGGRLE